MDPELVRIGLENKQAIENARAELLALRKTVKDFNFGLTELGFPSEKSIERMRLLTLQTYLNRLRPEVNQRLTASNNATGQKIGIQFSDNPNIEENSDDDDEASSSQVLKPVQPSQQNLIVYQDPRLLNYFQRIERSTIIDLDRDLKNAGIPDETIVNLNMDEKQEYAKLIREMNYGSASRLVGSSPNPKFKDLLDNRYTDQYIFEAGKAAVLANKPLKLPPIEELWQRQKELKPVPSSEVRFNKFVNLKQLNPFERHALKYHDNRPGVAPRYKNQGAPQKDDPIVYGGKLHLQKRIPTNPTRLVI